MNIIGADFVRATLEADGYFLKLIVNESAAHFFAQRIEHRDATLPGLYYRDASQGNALAGTIKPRQIDMRFHRAFPDERVRTLMRTLLENPQLDVLSVFAVNYQGRELIAASSK